LARRYTTTDGDIRPERAFAGFRGTARYASINSHQCRDLSRRDDIWSILFILVEFATGSLPWRKLRDKDKIGEMKKEGVGPYLVSSLPPQILAFMDHLQTLEYADQPDYQLLKKLLQQSLAACSGGNANKPFPWENGTAPLRLRAGTLNSNDKQVIPSDMSSNSDATPVKELSTGHSSSVPSGSTDTKPSNNNEDPPQRFRLVKSTGRADSVAPIPRTRLKYSKATHVDLEASADNRESLAVDLENTHIPNANEKTEIESTATNNIENQCVEESPKNKKECKCDCKCCIIM